MEFEQWKQLSRRARVEIALKAIEAIGLRGTVDGFTGTGRFAETIPIVTLAESEFVIVPGAGRAELGFDGGLEALPAEMIELYREFGFGADELGTMFRDALALPHVGRDLSWCLVERVASPAWRLGKPPLAGSAKKVRVEGDTRLHYFDENGGLVEHEPRLSAAAVSDRLPHPWRLLRPDEWEYVCRAGAEGLFWWGNDWPPLETSPDEPGSFVKHIASNNWGLQIASDAYHWEFVDGPVMCGGDGGQGACGGEGPLGHWLPLSPSFRLRLSEAAPGVFGGYARRAATLRWP